MKSFSPLRYPGGKGKIYPHVVDLLEKSRQIGGTYVEPFAGGAGLAFRLLMEQKVSQIAINDIDRSIYAVWYAMLHETQDFLHRIESAEFSIEEWEKQKQIQKNKIKEPLITLAFSTLYLNRVQRSGIIKSAGLIGGLSQKGQYRMTDRFNKPALIELVRNISCYRDQISISNLDAIEFMEQLAAKQYFCFIDPPYYEKGCRLYAHFFNHADHQRLAKYLQGEIRNRINFLVSYDNSGEILNMYHIIPKYEYSLSYSLNITRVEKELFFINLLSDCE